MMSLCYFIFMRFLTLSADIMGHTGQVAKKVGQFHKRLVLMRRGGGGQQYVRNTATTIQHISFKLFISFPLLKLCNYRTNYQPREPVLCARRFIPSQAKDVPIACFVQPQNNPFWPGQRGLYIWTNIYSLLEEMFLQKGASESCILTKTTVAQN